MELIINGEKKNLQQGTLTIEELLRVESVENPQMVSVQHNGEFIRQEAYADTTLKEGDEINFLYFMGGGA